jgi:hypothetical protein
MSEKSQEANQHRRTAAVIVVAFLRKSLAHFSSRCSRDDSTVHS